MSLSRPATILAQLASEKARRSGSMYDGISTLACASLSRPTLATSLMRVIVGRPLPLQLSVVAVYIIFSPSTTTTTMPNEETTLIKARRPSVVKIQEEEQIHVPAGEFVHCCA